jgi:tetratricopeptide (TPR) repeat protein
MESYCFVQKLRSILPEDTQPWVINALRQDQGVWQSLQEENFSEKAISTCGDDPENWTPGTLSLLALDINLSIDELQTTPLQPLEAELRQKAYQTYENLTKGQPGRDISEAGLVGLALRERFRLIGTWKNFSGEILNSSEIPVTYWYTPLACLFNFIPDPFELLSALIYPGAFESSMKLGLHAFFCTPLSNTKRLSILQNLFSTDQFLNLSKPREFSLLLRLLDPSSHELAKELAKWFLEPGNHPDAIQTGLVDFAENMPDRDSIYMAEIYQTAGQTDKALAILSNALQGMRWLQAELAATCATSAEQVQFSESAEQNQEKILSYWQDAVDNTPSSQFKEGSSPFLSNLMLAKLQSGKGDEIQNQLSVLVEEDFSLETISDLEPLMAMAQISQQLGDLTHAIQYATRAATLVLGENDQSGEIYFEPLRTNLIRKTQANHRTLANILFNLRLYEKCIEILDFTLKTSQNDPDLLFLQGKAYQALFKQENANLTFQIALMLNPNAIDIRRSLADGLEAAGDWVDALKERQKLLEKINPEHSDELIDAFHSLSRCAMQAGNLDLAIETCQKAISYNPDDGLAYVCLGEASLKRSNLIESQEYYNQAVQLRPDLPEPWLGLIKIFRATGENEKIIDTLKEAIQASPLSYEIHLAIGEEYLKLGSNTQAQMSFQRAYELINEVNDQTGELYWRIALNLGNILLQLGHTQEANEVLGKAYRQAQLGGFQQPELAYSFAKTLLALDKISQAIPVLKDILLQSPQDSKPYLDYARALLTTQGDSKDAVRVLQRVLEMEPNHLEAQVLLAEALLESGNQIDALKTFQSTLETDLSKDRKWVSRISYGIGCSALALGYFDTAIAALQEAIHADPTRPIFHQKLCEAYWSASLNNNAIQAARSTLNLDTDDADILLWFAEQAIRFYQYSIPKNQISGQENNCEDVHPDRLYGIKPRQVLIEAMNSLSQATQIAPQRADICLRLGELQILAGEKQLAIESFREVLTKEIITLEIIYQTADWLTKLNEYHAAVSCLERGVLLLKAKQNDIPCDLMEDLSQAYLQIGNTEAALDILYQAIASYPQKVILYLKIAQIYVQSARIENALSILNDALSILVNSDDRANIYYHLAQLKRAQGDLNGAMESAEQAFILSESKEHPEGFDWLHLSKHYLAADLARALLRTKAARGYLEEKFHTLLTAEQMESINPEAIDTLIGYYCLKSELALDEGEEIEAANALTPAVQVAPTHPRTLALQARFQHRRGDDHLALKTLNEALIQLPIPQHLGGNGLGMKSDHLDQKFPNPHVPSDEKGFSSNDFLSVVEAALELNQWDLASHLVIIVVENNPREPYRNLSLASVLVRKAELQCLYQQLEVVTHAPGVGALSSEQAREFNKSIELAKLAFQDDSDEIPLLSMWDCRGQVVFEQYLNKEGDEFQQIQWDFPPPNPETAVAQMIDYLRKSKDQKLNDHPYKITPSDDVAEPQDPYQLHLKIAVRSAQAFPQSALVQLAAGLLHEKTDLTKALSFAQQAVNIQDTTYTSLTALCHVFLARIAFYTGNQNLSIQAINTALSIWPDEPNWHALAATIQSQSEDTYEDALPHLETAAQLEPQNYAHLINLGLLQQKIAKSEPAYLKNALKSFEKASLLKPEIPDAWHDMAETYLLEGSHPALKHAAAFADRAISLTLSDPKNDPPLQTFLLRAEIAIKMNEPSLADQYSQKVLNVDPQNSEAAWLRAQALEDMKRPQEALIILEEIKGSEAESTRFQIKKAVLYRQTQEPAVAVKSISMIAEKNPNHPALLSLLAQTLSDAGQKEAALQAAQLALQPNPNQDDLEAREKAKLHHLIGIKAVEAGHLDNAIHHLDAAIELDPSFVEPYLELGFAYNKQRQYLKAQKIFLQATVIAPDDSRPFLHSGLALKEGKDYQAAETMLKRAAQLAPTDVQIRKHLAAVAALNLVHNPHNTHIAAER